MMTLDGFSTANPVTALGPMLTFDDALGARRDLLSRIGNRVGRIIGAASSLNCGFAAERPARARPSLLVARPGAGNPASSKVSMSQPWLQIRAASLAGLHRWRAVEGFLDLIRSSGPPAGYTRFLSLIASTVILWSVITGTPSLKRKSGGRGEIGAPRTHNSLDWSHFYIHGRNN